MKNLLWKLLPCVLATTGLANGQAANFTSFIRQHQFPSGIQWDVSVPAAGEQLSALAIDPGGARFELWTVRNDPPQSFLLDTRYVGAYIPMAEVTVRSNDPHGPIPRTRADQPFYVDVNVSGLQFDAAMPESARRVKFLRHIQSYGTGTGENIDRSQAILKNQWSITTNGTKTLTYAVTAIPGADLAKIRGEERFSIFSLEDYQAPESQIASQTIQVWPVADGTLAGITHGGVVKLQIPPLTLTLNDLYPTSTTYAQVYEGAATLGMTGKIVPGSALSIQNPTPQNRVLIVKDYGEVFDKDGIWTIELVTVTPFGTDRLAYVTFELDRTIKVQGTMTTFE